MSLFSTLAIGRSSLLAHQRALQTVAQNVSNVDTPGYTRQRLRLDPENGAFGQGAGVSVAGLEQLVDRFVEQRRLEANTGSAAAGTRSELLDRLQALFPVDGGGVPGALSGFFAAARALADQPQSIPARQQLLDRANALAATMRNLAGSLASLQREADDRLAGQVDDANQAMDTIAALNRQIALGEANGGSTGELRDRRRVALQTLSGVLQVRAVERSDGTVDVYAADGQGLVLGDSVKRLEVVAGTTAGLDGAVLHDVVARSPGAGATPFIGSPGGRIGVLLDLRDTVVPDVASDLDALALTLRDGTNAVHASATAFDLDGLAGGNLFTASGAADLTVAITDPRRVAASQTATLPSDNSNALALAAVERTAFPALGNASLIDFHARMVAAVGQLSSDATTARASSEGVQAAVEAEREAVSGVSLEQEFTDMVRFQRGFQAASQLIVVSNEMLDDLLGLVR